MSSVWSAYEYQPSFVLGFHGCDKEVGERILCGEEPHLKHSEQKYDWLGHGIYFWEGNPSRAMDWATQRKKEGKSKRPLSSELSLIYAIALICSTMSVWYRSRKLIGYTCVSQRPQGRQ